MMIAKKIRTKLKEELGYNSRKVSVKYDQGWILTIRSIDVDYLKVVNFYRKNIRNGLVDYVEFSNEIINEIVDTYENVVTKAFNEVKTHVNSGYEIEGTNIILFSNSNNPNGNLKYQTALKRGYWHQNARLVGAEWVTVGMRYDDIDQVCIDIFKYKNAEKLTA